MDVCRCRCRCRVGRQAGVDEGGMYMYMCQRTERRAVRVDCCWVAISLHLLVLLLRAYADQHATQLRHITSLQVFVPRSR